MLKNLSLFRICALLVIALCSLPDVVRSQTINLNQNSSQLIASSNTATCNNGTYTAENHYYRSFKISDYTAANSFTVDSILFAIDFAYSASGNGQPVTISLYSSTAVIPTLSSLTLLNSVTGTVPDFSAGAGGFMRATMNAVIPGTGNLVVEVAFPDGISVGNAIFIGSNTASQTKPSYIYAPTCSINDITSLANVGATTQQSLLINVYGRPYNGTPLTMPGDFINPVDTVCEEAYAVTYTVPQVAGLTYNWVYTGSGISVNSSSPINQNSLILDFPFGATSGSLGVYTSNSGTISPTRWLPITVLPALSNPGLNLNNGVLSCVGTFTSYVWYKNGTIIPGATAATYTPTQGGDYYVIASNGVCEAASELVTVLDAPGPITNASNPVCANTTGVNISVPLIPGFGSYTWTYSGTGVAINNNGNNAVTADFAANATSGTLRVIYFDGFNYSIAATQNITVNAAPVPTISRAGNVLTAAGGTFTSYEWYRNNVAITGATSNTYTMTQPGNYYVKVTNSNSCVGSSTPVQIDDVVGIKDIELAGKIRIYPNPAKDMVTIESPVMVNVTLSRIDGRVVSTFNNAKKIDLKSLAAGVYFITLTDNDGVYLKKDKLVKIN